MTGLFRYLIVSFYIICYTNAWYPDSGLLEWIWPRSQDGKKEIMSSAPLIQIPFESKTEDEKFLEEATKFTDIIKSSALDSCQHKVVLKIKSSCSSMTEEELAKMSVNLLNCQSAVDGRKTFPCTDSMTLRECTENMDATMWNAYHMMNNRARAVCLAARRSQFQALSEMTVNKLMSAAHSQIKKMNVMVESQNKLERLTLGTINLIEKGNIEILEQQAHLRANQKGVQDFISHNLQKLIKEKALIAAGHKELSKMTENIREKIDEVNNQLQDQLKERAEHHKELLSDVEAIENQAKQIFQRIDISTETLLRKHSEAASKYDETIRNLVKINETVHYLLRVIEKTRLEIDKKFLWVQTFLDVTGIRIEKISATASHIAYLLLAMLLSSFLNVSMVSRGILILMVPLNLFMVYNERTDLVLNYVQMSAVLLTTTALHWLLKPVDHHPSLEYLENGKGNATSETNRNNCDVKKTFQSCGHLLDKLKSLVSNHRGSRNICVKGSKSVRRRETVSDEDRTVGHVTNDGEVDCTFYSPSVDMRSEASSHSLVREWLRTKMTNPPSASSESSTQKMCAAICSSSQRRCRNLSSRGSEYCYRHMYGNSEVS